MIDRIFVGLNMMLPAIALAFGWLAGCGAIEVAAQTGVRGRELHETYELAPNGSVGVSNLSGYIRVTSWDENRVKVDAVKRGQRGEDPAQVEIQITATTQRIEIRTLYPRGSSNISVDYDLKVPRTSSLSTLNSTSGEITITGPVARAIARSTSGNIHAAKVGGEFQANTTSGNVVVSEIESRLFVQATAGSVTAMDIRDDATVGATSGNVKLERIGGRAVARSLSGWISVSDVGGDAQAESTSQNVTINKVRGRVNAHSLSGSIVVREASEGVRAGSISGKIEVYDSKGRIEVGSTSAEIILDNIESRDILVRSTSGPVRFAGKVSDDGHYEFESFSSDVVLILPPESSFTLTTKSQTGSVNTEFPLQLGRRPTIENRGYLAGTVGKGGAEIRAASFSGSVHIKKSTGQPR